MTIIDKIIAMILDREIQLPCISNKTHQINIISKHIYARKLWLLDFGCFPIN